MTEGECDIIKSVLVYSITQAPSTADAVPLPLGGRRAVYQYISVKNLNKVAKVNAHLFVILSTERCATAKRFKVFGLGGFFKSPHKKIKNSFFRAAELRFVEAEHGTV